jgi:hypothetical protein
MWNTTVSDTFYVTYVISFIILCVLNVHRFLRLYSAKAYINIYYITCGIFT